MSAEETKIEDGGTAFPLTEPVYRDGERAYGQSPGMSLRDYLAAKAMEGVLAGRRTSGAPTFAAEDDAEYCYRVADAMLAARKR
jgi:hypothetical protein